MDEYNIYLTRNIERVLTYINKLSYGVIDSNIENELIIENMRLACIENMEMFSTTNYNLIKNIKYNGKN